MIAVFGRSESDKEREALAKKIGHTIAVRGHILLTGGTEPKEGSVKNMAIKGTDPSPWVGVPQESGHPTQDLHTGKRGPVVTSGLGRKRNYLEAWMCDAAIALSGRSGTRSEAAFSLLLGRPVAFVGKGWHELCRDLGTCGHQALKNEVTGSTWYVGRSEFVNERQILTRLERLPKLTFAFFSSTPTPDEVIEWVEQHASTGQGRSPHESGLGEWKARYDTWLAENRR